MESVDPAKPLQECQLPGVNADGRNSREANQFERAERIHRQRPKDKHKLCALHAPEADLPPSSHTSLRKV